MLQHSGERDDHVVIFRLHVGESSRDKTKKTIITQTGMDWQEEKGILNSAGVFLGLISERSVLLK